MRLDWITSLVRSQTSRLARTACAEGLSGIDALDAVQEGLASFLLLPQARRLAAAPEEAAALLSVVVRNVARNLRRRHHRARPHVSDGEVVEALADPLPSADELVARAEEHVRLLGCMHKLSDVQQRVVTLRLLEELSGHETAATLGVSPENAAVLLHRAKVALRDCVEASTDLV
jgi:RNA polymerase sigma-70 factor (ECF subfamily)